jgi:hypothetical protein
MIDAIYTDQMAPFRTGPRCLEGEARAVRYTALPQVIEAAAQASAEIYVPTSAEGLGIKAYVRQARQLRKPAVDQLGLLEQYRTTSAR